MSFVQGLSDSLANNKSTSEIGIGGFTAFARISESVTYTSNVPVDVLEDGSNASDNIENNPITITIDGSVGDVYVEGRQFPAIIPRDITTLGEVSALLPAKSQQQFQRITQINDQIRDAILQAERIERIGQSVYDFVSGGAEGGKTPQQKFVDYMEAIHKSKQPISLSTSYKDYQNMALQELTISRNNQDGAQQFTATFMQINYADLVYVEVSQNYSSPSNAAAQRTSAEVNNGGQNPETSLATDLRNGFR